MDQDSYRELVQVVVEHSILDMGVPELEKIKERLMEDYNLTTADSLDHPEYIKEVLRDLFGNSYRDILNTMYIAFDHAMQEEYQEIRIIWMEEKT